MIQAQKRLTRTDDYPFYNSVNIKPQIFKKQTTIDMDKYRMFTFSKYLQKLQEVIESDQEKLRNQRENPRGMMSPSSCLSPMAASDGFKRENERLRINSASNTRGGSQ